MRAGVAPPHSRRFDPSTALLPLRRRPSPVTAHGHQLAHPGRTCRPLGRRPALCSFGCPRSRALRVRATASAAVDQATSAPATAPPSVPAASGEPRSATDSTNDTSKAPFVWTRLWWPLLPEAYLRPDRPNPVTLLGIPMVVWRDGAGSWRVFKDRCPHRLAPLSEGRVEADGTLSCSYHGWRFGGSGACRHIPQAVSPAAEAAACASRRACATAFPAQLKAGMLWVWPDESPDAAAAAVATPLMISNDLLDRDRKEAARVAKQQGAVDAADSGEGTLPIDWFVRDLPYSYEILLENLTDPAHLPFSHHGTIGSLQRSLGGPMPMQPPKETPSEHATQKQGQLQTQQQKGATGAEEGPHAAASSSAAATWAAAPPHWARPSGPDIEYDFVGNVSRDATVSIHMPYTITYNYRVGQAPVLTQMFAVPVAPGRSRFLGVNREVPNKLPPLHTVGPRQALEILKWRYDNVVSSHSFMNDLLDGDSVFLHIQDEALQQVRDQALEAHRGAAITGASERTNGGDGSNRAASNGSGGGPSLWSRIYYLPTPSDRAMVAARAWLDEQAGGGPFCARQQQLLASSGAQPAQSHAVAGEAPDTQGRARLLNRYEQHTRHCPACRTRLEQLQRLEAAAQAVRTAAMLLGCCAGGALGAAAAAQGSAAVAGGWAGAVGAAVLAAVAWAAASWVADRSQRWAQLFLYTDYVHADRP